MPTYKLTYFDTTGVGEILRFLFAYGKIDYEDIRIRMEDWSSFKPKTKWGYLPILEIDGKEYYQSLAQARYLAKIFGIGGKNDMEDFLINIALDTVHEFRIETLKPFYESDGKKRKAGIEKMQAEHFPKYLPKLDEMARENDGYFALGRLTVADIYFVAFAPCLIGELNENFFEKYPNLIKVISNVENEPEIKKWIENRPPKIFFGWNKYFSELEAKTQETKLGFFFESTPNFHS